MAVEPSTTAPDTTSQLETIRRELADLAAAAARLGGKHVEALAGDVQRYGENKLSDMEMEIRRNPSRSMLIAGGVGLIAGLWLSR